MPLALSIFGVAFAAFCVWLTVRIVNRRERWAKRTAIALVVLLVAYPLSAGPVNFLYFYGYVSKNSIAAARDFYAPLLWLDDHAPKPIRGIFLWYRTAWI